MFVCSLCRLLDCLRDRLVAGVNNDIIQQRLLQNPGLTFQTALTICLAMETAAKNVHDLPHVALKVNQCVSTYARVVNSQKLLHI